MPYESKIYPLKLEICLQSIDVDASKIMEMDIVEACQLCEFIEKYKYDLEDIIINGMRSSRTIKSFLKKYAQYRGYTGSVLYTHFYAYLCALETEKDNDCQKGLTSGAIFDDHRKLRLIAETLNKHIGADI